MEIITRTDLIDYVSRAGVNGITTSQYDEAIARTTDRILQAGLNDYTADSLNSLTAVTAPGEMRLHALALALDSLTRADAGRSDNITDAATDAVKYLGYLAGGTTHYDEITNAVLVKRTNAGGAVHHFRKTERVFERGAHSRFDYRDEEI